MNNDPPPRKVPQFKVVYFPFVVNARKLPARECEVCGKGTREGKPFCTTHLDSSPYVKELVKTLKKRDAEDAKAANIDRHGAVNADGITAREILMHLEFHGSRTMERLCKELNVDHEAIKTYCCVLQRRGMLTQRRTRRGAIVYSLTDKAKDEHNRKLEEKE